MGDSPRIRRLRTDLKALEQLASESTIFSFEPIIGDPPEHYLIRFRGASVFREEHDRTIQATERHEVSVKFGSSYPRTMPTISWRTPIFHPNIASSGVVCLGAYGQHWAPSVTIDELCRMLWDMLRYANMDIESPYNRDAAQWARTNQALFPLDHRPLRDITAGFAPQLTHEAHIPPVRAPHVPVARPLVKVEQAEVLFLDDSDVIDAEIIEPPLRSTASGDDIFYIN